MSCVPVEGEWMREKGEREFQGEKRRNKSVGKNSHPKNQAILRLFKSFKSQENFHNTLSLIITGKIISYFD